MTFGDDYSIELAARLASLETESRADMSFIT
jgi:hypothetical protein